MSLSERLGRLLFIVPYVASRDGVPLAELAEKLGVTPAQIEADLDLLSMVGQPPLTPDHLIDLYVEDEVVYVDLDQSLSRPPPLTHEEARALVLGTTLVGHAPGLDGVLEKIMAALNPVDREMVRSLSKRVGIAQESSPGPVALLEQAVEEHREIELDYYSVSSDQKKSYRLRPLALLTHSGTSYLVAQDLAAEQHEKLFRADRMGEVRLLKERFAPPAELDLERFRTQRLYFGKGDVTAEVRFSPKVAPFVTERFHARDKKQGKDGSLTVRISTSSPAWLARWVLPFGVEAEVLGPEEARQALGKLCAEAAAAYGKGG